MNGQRTIKYLLGISLLVILLSGRLRAGPGFLDDFRDGSVQDGSPVTWGWEDDGQGQRLITDDGFSIRPNPEGHPWACVLDEQDKDAVYAGNMTIRTQFQMDNYSSGAHAGIYFRASRSGDYYLAGIIYNELFLSWSANDQWKFFQRCQIPGYNAAQHDIIIQIDVTDFTDSAGSRMSRLEVSGWMPGQDKPAQPQISIVDGKYDAGAICLYAYQSPATFRWVEVTPEPIVDFNGDGKVDTKDLLKMIRSWGQNDPSVDLNGDGTIDEEDLEALMNSWGQDVTDPTLLAHWALDETEGATATDRVGLGNGMFIGDPAWAPEGGAVNGALEFDGDGDAVVTRLVRDPAAGPFSVFAWVKGGGPGQVVVSQANGADWLMADSATGTLATGLSPASLGPKPLVSASTFTDGDWHRVGFTWDGSRRALYLDDVLVGADAQDGLAACVGGLNLGTGAKMTGFFSGLIDEVRLYNRAVQP